MEKRHNRREEISQREEISVMMLTVERMVSDDEQCSRRQSRSIFLGDLQNQKHRLSQSQFHKIRGVVLVFRVDFYVPNTCSHHVPMIWLHFLAHILECKLHSLYCKQDFRNLDFPWNTVNIITGMFFFFLGKIHTS